MSDSIRIILAPFIIGIIGLAAVTGGSFMQSLSHNVLALSAARGAVADLNASNKMFFQKQFLDSLRKEIAGHYSNPSTGITDILFPPGWHGRAIQTPFALLVNMHPGNETNFLANLLSRQVPAIKPIMMLQVVNNSELSKLRLPNFSISKNCKELAANSTTIIEGKSFHTYTVECPFSKLYSGLSKSLSVNNRTTANASNFATDSQHIPKNFNINGIGQSKVFEYKTPDRTYRLMLVVSSPLFVPSGASSSSATQQKPDITKYIPLIDSTAKTLKIK